MRQKYAVLWIASICCFAYGCVATNTSLKDTSPNGSFTAPGDAVVLSYEQDVGYDSTSNQDGPSGPTFATGCSASPTQSTDCSTILGTVACTSVGANCTATLTTTTLAAGTYEIYAFNNLGVSNSVVHVVTNTEPVASKIALPAPATTTFGQPVALMPSVSPFPLTGNTGSMGTFEAFYSGSHGGASLGSAFASPTGYDGRGIVVAPGLQVALDVGTTNVDAVYHAPSGAFPTESSAASAPVAAVVSAATTHVTVSASDVAGSPVTLTATLAANVTAAGFPSGLTFSNTAGNATLTFYADNQPIGTGTLVAGSGVTGAPSFTLTTTALSDGPHAIYAVYGGNARFASDQSPVLEIAPTTANGTSMTLAASKSPVMFGDSVTFTATITTSAGSPSGTVQFRDVTDTTPVDLGTATVTPGNLSSTATISTSALVPGTRSISAIYSGDAGHPGGAVASLAEVVDKAIPQIIFTSSAPVSVYGQPVTFTVNVTAPGQVSSGQLTIYDGTLQVGSGVGGTASGTTTILPVGTHDLKAVYSGDPRIADTSAALTQNVTRATAKLALSASSQTSARNVNVTFTAVVSAQAPGAAQPTGTVTFNDGATLLGTSAIGAGGVATLDVHGLTQGTHAITASYAGDAHLTAATGEVDHKVTDKGTTLQVSANPTQSAYGSPVTIAVRISGAIGVPSGAVTFAVGGATVGTATFDGSGAANLVTSTLPVGTTTVTASFAGDTLYPAGSGSVTIVIGTGATTTTLASSANPATTGTAVTFTATVNAGGAQATGDVTFFDGAVAIGQATLANGSATLTRSDLTAGPHSIVATYQGSPNLQASKSDALVETIGGATNGGPTSTAGGSTTPAKPTGPVTTVGGESSGCASTPSAPTNGVVVLLATAAALGAMRRRKRAA